MSESVKLSADVDGKLVEENIAVNIPKTWDFTNAEKTEKTSFMKSLKAADIEIGGEVTTMRPWTVQHQGCGEKGVTVRISEEFFYNNNDNFDSKLKGGWDARSCGPAIKPVFKSYEAKNLQELDWEPDSTQCP